MGTSPYDDGWLTGLELGAPEPRSRALAPDDGAIEPSSAARVREFILERRRVGPFTIWWPRELEQPKK